MQIDDWNENKKKAKLERKILKEIQVDLQNDLEEITNEMESYQWIEKADSSLEVFFHSSAPFADSIGSFIYAYEISPHFNPIDGGYQLLKAKGIDLITNDSLRIEINSYYEQSIPYYFKYESERVHTVLNDFIPFNNQYFYLGRVSYFPFWKRIPNDLHTLRKNKQWLSMIQKSGNLAHVLFYKASIHQEKIIRLSDMVESTLNNSTNLP